MLANLYSLPKKLVMNLNNKKRYRQVRIHNGRFFISYSITNLVLNRGRMLLLIAVYFKWSNSNHLDNETSIVNRGRILNCYLNFNAT